jgi:hypothetical protein
MGLLRVNVLPGMYTSGIGASGQWGWMMTTCVPRGTTMLRLSLFFFRTNCVIGRPVDSRVGKRVLSSSSFFFVLRFSTAYPRGGGRTSFVSVPLIWVHDLMALFDQLLLPADERIVSSLKSEFARWGKKESSPSLFLCRSAQALPLKVMAPK